MDGSNSQPSTNPDPNSMPTETAGPAAQEPLAEAPKEEPKVSIGSASHVPAPTGRPEDAPQQTQPTVVQGTINAGRTARIVLIILIALILGAAAIYFYLKGKTNTAQPSSSSTPSSVTTKTGADKDVNDTIDSIDSTIKTSDETGDLAPDDLTASALGL